ncbi:peptidyl-prolyl cis-trans isomerase [Aneurinibacillus sp. BA2021]|nr:peptidyl-prolyl cis-trans isomerase [Aneurinibacillus sp. BA2021]
MAEVITINGNVAFAITIDPSVWIFDDRKFKMEDFFASIGEEPEETEDDSLMKMGQQWDKELTQGVAPTKKSEQLFVEKKRIVGDYGIKLEPFLKNAEVKPEAKALRCELSDGSSITVPLADAYEAVLCFAIDGKPIREDGPVHLYYGDGRNMDAPIRGIVQLIVE